MRRRTRERIQAILVVMMLFAMLCACSYVEHHYTRKDCVVVEVEQRLVTVEDKAGHQWCYYMDSEDYADVPRVGDVVDLKMYTNITDNTIYDDEIVKVVVH